MSAPTPAAPGSLAPGSEAEGTEPAQAELPLLGSAPAETAMTAPNGNSGARAYVRGIRPDAKNRARDDFYPTPPEGTWALLSAIRFKGTIWEPACGDGSISRVLEAAGYKVTSTDLVDRGYGTSPVDFLLDYHTMAQNIITNPPFKLAEEFARHALDRATDKVALLARSPGWKAMDAGSFSRAHPSGVSISSAAVSVSREDEPPSLLIAVA